MDNELEQMIIKQKIKIKQLKKEIANNKEIVNEYSYNGQRYNNQNIDLKRENFLLKRKINENDNENEDENESQNKNDNENETHARA